MSFKDITELEDEWCGCGRVFLHLQGGFYVLYDRSAFLFWKNVSSMKLTMRFVKSINREIVKLGFPKNSAEKWLYGHQVFNMSDNVLYFDTDWTVDDEEYMVFLDTARMQTKAADRMTPTVSVIAGQPVYQVAKALALQCKEVGRNIFKPDLYPYGNNMKELSNDICYYVGRFYDNDDRKQAAADIREACLRLEHELTMLSEGKEHTLSRNTYMTLCDMSNSVRGQITALVLSGERKNREKENTQISE